MNIDGSDTKFDEIHVGYLQSSGMAAVLETRLRQAQTDKFVPLDLISTLVSDELLRRQDRLLERRHTQARFPRSQSLRSIVSTLISTRR